MILGALCVMKPGLMWMPVLCAVNLATLDSVSDVLMLCNTLFSNQVAIAILVQLLHACPVSDLIACNSCSTFFYTLQMLLHTPELTWTKGMFHLL